jgi:hypothetical protein
MGRQGISHAWGRTEVKSLVKKKTERNRPLGRPRCGQEDNTKMDLKEIIWGGGDGIQAQDGYRWRALVNNIEPSDRFGLHQMLDNASEAEQLLTSQIFSVMKLINLLLSDVRFVEIGDSDLLQYCSCVRWYFKTRSLISALRTNRRKIFFFPYFDGLWYWPVPVQH